MAGRSSARNAAAAGSQEEWREGGSTRTGSGSTGSRRSAPRQQRGVGAQEAGLPARTAAEPARTSDDGPPISVPLTKMRSKVCCRRPEPGERADDHPVDQLVEVPLVDEEPVQRGKPLAERDRGLAVRGAPESCRRCRRPARPGRRPAPARPTAARCSARGGSRSRRTSAPRTVEPGRDLRDQHDPADRRQHRERAHRELHRQRPLGDAVLGAGEADVGALNLAVGGIGGCGACHR